MTLALKPPQSEELEEVSAFYTLTDTKGGTVKAEVVLGAEGEEAEEGAAVDEEDGIKADD